MRERDFLKWVSGVGDDGVLQGSDAFDFHFADVAGFQEHLRFARNADTRRRTGEDEVAGFERDDLRDEGEHGGYSEDEFLGAGILHGLAVQSELDFEVVRVDFFVGGDDPGTGGCEGVEGFADGPLLFFAAELPVAGGDVVPAGVTADVLECGGIVGDVFGGFADDDDEFGFVVDLLGDFGQLDRIAVRDERVGVFREDDGFGGNGFPAFDGVIAIVQPDADDLAGFGNRRQDFDGVCGEFDGIGVGGGGCDQLPQRGRSGENGLDAGG